MTKRMLLHVSNRFDLEINGEIGICTDVIRMEDIIIIQARRPVAKTIYQGTD
jgi:hypothetical protein